MFGKFTKFNLKKAIEFVDNEKDVEGTIKYFNALEVILKAVKEEKCEEEIEVDGQANRT